MTDDLIERLSADIRPTPRGVPLHWLLLAALASIAISAAIMIPWIGLRPDIGRAYLNPTFWAKFAYTAAFLAIGIWTAVRLSRPGGSLKAPLIAAGTLIAVTGLAGIVQILMLGPDSIRRLVLGVTALVCPFYVLALSVPALVVTIAVMRRLAPTNLVAGGFAAGLMAGGIGCWVYAFHCAESGLPFVAIWYSLGILLPGVFGAIIGRWALRW
jgi:hypothetical protein